MTAFSLEAIHSDAGRREGFFVGLLRQLSWTDREDTDVVAGCVLTGGVEGGLACARELAKRRGDVPAAELEELLIQNGF